MAKSSASKQEFRFISTLEKSTNRLWGCHIGVPAKVAKQLIDSTSHRVICNLNVSAEYQCAILHRGKDLYLITVNKKLRDELELNFGDNVNVALKKDTSEYGLPLPDELKEVLKQDPQGDKVFHALTRGKQRTLLYIIGNVKQPDKRIMHALVIIRHLKAHKGKINYKQLSIALKDPTYKSF
jgi:hypothetical protein